MKTIQELFNEISQDKDLKAQALALKPEEVIDFAAKHGCTTDLKGLEDFFKSKIKNGEVSDEDLALVTGGAGGNFKEGDKTECYCSVCGNMHPVKGDITDTYYLYLPYCPDCGAQYHPENLVYKPKMFQ